MFVAYSRNTEASARPKPAEDDGWVTRSMFEVRRQRTLEALARKQQAEAAERARIRAIREEANRAIAAGNNALREMRLKNHYQANPKVLIRRICRVFDINPAMIYAHTNGKRIVFARQAVMYWLARQTLESIASIGRALDRDHTSVLHGVDVYREKRQKMGRTLRRAR